MPPTIPGLDTIYLGDCLDLLKRVPEETVQLVVSSPPYNLGKEYESRRELDEYLAEQRTVLAECVRVLRPGGSVFWQVGAYADRGELIPLDIRIFPMLEGLGLTPRNRIVWVRQHGVHARRKFSCRHEAILWFTKGDDYVFNLDPIRVPQKYQNKKAWKGEKKGQLTCHPDGKNPGDIWVFRNVKHNHEEETIHPCQFPEDMVARIVLATTEPDDIVLDPYMGAGTVAVVAQETGRHFLGAELDQRYHQVAMRRLSGEPDQEGSFPNLKTLRDYAERTGVAAQYFRFDTQVGEEASDRSKAKIYSEEHHLEQLQHRLELEEQAFAEKWRDGSEADATQPASSENESP
jgi:adenine-specific DNA-methyltransferase